MPRGCAEMTGTRARSHASLIRALNAWLLKGAPSRPGKINGDPVKSTPPPRRRTPFTLSRIANHSSSEPANSFVRGRSRKAMHSNCLIANRLRHVSIHIIADVEGERQLHLTPVVDLAYDIVRLLMRCGLPEGIVFGPTKG